MRISVIAALIATPALASADSTGAELRAGVAVIGMQTDAGVAPDGLSMVPGYSAAGIVAGTAGGDVYLDRRGGAAVGFAFSYQRSRTFRSITERADGEAGDEFDTLYSMGTLGAVGRSALGGGASGVGRVEVGRSRLSFEPRADDGVDLAELPASEYRFIRIGGELEQRFGTIRVGVGAGFSSAYSIAGAGFDVMQETRGLVFDGRLSAGLMLGSALEVVTAASGNYLTAGAWHERHFGIDLGLAVHM